MVLELYCRRRKGRRKDREAGHSHVERGEKGEREREREREKEG